MASRLRELILDQIEFHNLEMEDVLKKAEFPEHYFDAILTEQHDKLPAFPYMRNHLVDLARQLEVEPEKVLSLYKKEFSEKISGEHDKLPGNRFALPSSRKAIAWSLSIIGILIVAYVFLSSSFFGRPNIQVAFPPANPDPFIVTGKTITLSGSVGKRDSLKVNGEEVVVQEDGTFLTEYPLQVELNSISFEVQRFLGSTTRLVRQVYYDDSQAGLEAPTTTSSIIEETSTSTATSTDEEL